jgi:hypothetical protein
MEIINQQNAWIASMISAGVGTCSLLVAAIVNRQKISEFFKTYFWLVLSLFFVAGAWSFYQFGGLAYVVRLWRRIEQWLSKGVPIWAILLSLCCLILLWKLGRFIAKFFKNIDDQQPRKPLSPDDIRVEDYTEDLIDGVWWHWTYSGNTVKVPKPICPNQECQCDLFFREDWMRLNTGPNVARIGEPPVSLHCPRCNFRRDFDNVEGRVLHDVTQEILSQIRTDRFRVRLYNRLVSAKSSRS